MDEMLGVEKATLVLDCLIQKMQANYENLSAAMDDDSAIKIFIDECLSSVVGMEEFYQSAMESQRADMNEMLGQTKSDLFIQCVVQNLVAKYPTLSSLSDDEDGFDEINQTCMSLVMPENAEWHETNCPHGILWGPRG